jgi:hypothetical protein
VLVGKSAFLSSLGVGFAGLALNTAAIMPARKPKTVFVCRRPTIVIEVYL